MKLSLRPSVLVGALVVGGGFFPPTAAAQVPCAALPPPSGTVVAVTPQQAGSLASIVAAATTGTTVLLADGFYDLSCGDTDCRLMFSTPGVTLRSANGNRDAVVLDGAYLTNELVSIYASNVVIADLTLRRAYDHPVHISGPSSSISGILLHNLRIVDPGQQAIKVNPIDTGYVDSGTIECCSLELTDTGRAQIRDNCYTGGIDAHAAWGWLVRRNRISGFWCAAGLSEHAIHFWNASRDTVVEENVIVDCARGVGFGLLAVSGDRAYPDDPYPGVGYLGHIDGVIRNNFIAAADPDLLQSDSGFDAGIALEQSRNTWVMHNSVVSTAAPFSSIEWRFGNTLVQIVNNLVSHNLRERDGNPQEVLAGNLEGAQPGWFQSVPQGDLHLVGGALPPVDAGAAVAAGLADRDIDFEARPAARDIGADEVVPALFADGFESGNPNAWSAVLP